jgi:hypothetical protein
MQAEAIEQTRGRGQPTLYRPDYARQAREICARGATLEDLAAIFGTTRQTIHNWSLQHQEFFDALKAGREARTDRVEASLYRKALGYSYESEKILVIDNEVVRVPVVEHVPPSDTAMIFTLKNARPKDWRDKHEVSMTAGGADDMTRDQVLERIEALEALLRGAPTITVEALPAPSNDAD